MTFIYTYRGTSGAIEKAEIEAGSRSEVFALLKERGISPMQVQEGKLPKSRKFDQGVKTNPRIIIGAAVAVLAVVAALVFVVPNGDDAGKTARGKKSATTKQASAMEKPVAGTASAKSPASSTNAIATGTENAGAKVAATPAQASPTNTVGNSTSNKVIVVDRGPGVFKNSTEQLLSMIFTCELGNTPPPLPRITNVTKEQLEAILASPNVVGEKDSAKVADAKRTVELAKKELKDYLDKGGDVNEFMAYYRGQLLQAHNLWKDEQVAMMKTCREEDPEVARAMLEATNKRLSEKGIKPIMMPPIYKKKLGLE